MVESNYETSHDRALWDRERAAKWAEDPASEPQLAFIRRLLGDSAGDLDYDDLTKRDATILIECAKRRAQETNLRKYGVCPLCGRALKVSKSGKSIVCESNSWNIEAVHLRLRPVAVFRSSAFMSMKNIRLKRP